MIATYSYESALKNAAKVNWRLEDIIGGNKHLDFSKRFLPETLASVNKISCLNSQEKLLLNQIRGHSYLHIFGLIEEVIVPMVINHVQETGLEDIIATQALLHFAEEESKHIQLFRRFAEEFEQGFGSRCDCIGPVQEIANGVLQHSPLGVILVILYIEWMTQYHYLESIRDNYTDNLDRQFCSLLKNHWLEEAQHAHLDTLMLQQLVSTLAQEMIATGVEDCFKIIDFLNGGLMKQVQLDIESLSRATGRSFTERETQELQSVQEQSYQWTFIGSGINHRNFIRTFNEVLPSYHESFSKSSQQYCSRIAL